VKIYMKIINEVMNVENEESDNDNEGEEEEMIW